MNARSQWIRLLGVLLVVCAAFTGLGIRLTYLHLGPNEEVRTRIQASRHYERTLVGTRGRILDRNGEILSLDLAMKHIGVDAHHLYESTPDEAVWEQKVKGISARLAYLLGRDRAEIEYMLEDTGDQHEYIKKYVMPEQAAQIAQLDIPCVTFEETKARHYPKEQLMCHVLGFANHEGVGSAGVEMSQQHFLTGKEGLRVGRKDGRRREMYGERRIDIAAAEGMHVHLTVDQYLQHMVEEQLDVSMRDHSAKGAWAVVLDVKTGDVLAMASRPFFDPNRFNTSTPEQRRNRVIGFTYEPGSTVKPLTLAAAFNEGLVRESELIDCENGRWMHAGRPLKDYHAYETLSVPDVLKKSSNIGTAKIALRLGEQRLESYFKAFGLGEKTGVALPGEEQGIFRSRNRWSALSLSRIAMGHEISVTALQLANAINAIANDGFLMKPRLVSKVTDSEGRTVYASKPEVLSRPITRDTAQLMQRLMSRITEKGGTGRRAGMLKFKVAGKTGTAEKAVNGAYKSSANIASFVGFLPAENPQITMVVVVDEPQPLHTGGAVAAPVFKEIAQQAVRYLNISPDGVEQALVMR